MSPAVGRTYSLAENDYQYGTGPLLVRITRVIGQLTYAGEPWWEVEAMCKTPGTVGPAHERSLYVRSASLATTRSP